MDVSLRLRSCLVRKKALGRWAALLLVARVEIGKKQKHCDSGGDVISQINCRPERVGKDGVQTGVVPGTDRGLEG